jgi:hypothetical protein
MRGFADARVVLGRHLSGDLSAVLFAMSCMVFTNAFASFGTTSL